jgi:alkaline phosphatase
LGQNLLFPYLVFGVAVILCSSCRTPFNAPTSVGAAKNIIFMVPDGMGLADVTAARIYKGGEAGPPLALETLPQIGYQRTYSADSTITDSAAAASAWATGQKYNNGQISWHRSNNGPTTILEIAKAGKRATGLVATSGITHATPAAFAAHVSSRNAQGEIARQYVEETQVDVMLGGAGGFSKDSRASGPLALAAVERHGYVLVTNAVGLARAVADHAPKVLGLFTAKAKTPETYRVTPDTVYPATEPTLADMTTAALGVLARDPEGFFLLVEGSRVDWANHGNDYAYQLGEVLGFDAAVESVLAWVKASAARRRDTLVVVVADHETGGFAINGPKGKRLGAGQLPEAGWTTKGHTGNDTIIWSQGPGSSLLGGALDNTDLFGVMKRVFQKTTRTRITQTVSDLSETP